MEGAMTRNDVIQPEGESLFDRVASILEQARANVVRSVNANMVLAYWLIGREIVIELQGGEDRAEYGKQVIENLSERLTCQYGKGFSAPTLWSFRQFYQAYLSHEPLILYPAGRELEGQSILYPAGRELEGQSILYPPGGELPNSLKSRPMAAESPRSETLAEIARPVGAESLSGFSPQLSWSHYRALMRVNKLEAREFYERETIACGWDKRSLLLPICKPFCLSLPGYIYAPTHP